MLSDINKSGDGVMCVGSIPFAIHQIHQIVFLRKSCPSNHKIGHFKVQVKSYE